MRKIPQKSTPIINEIIEKLARINLSAYESSILMAIIRKTYGWNKKEDWISGSQMAATTGILSNHCYRTVKKLVNKKILKKNGNRLGLNKRVHEWVVPERVLPNEVLPNQDLLVPKQVPKDTQTGSSKVPKQVLTKETITKETTTKDNIQEKGENKVSPTPAQIMKNFIENVKQRNPEFEALVLRIQEKSNLPIEQIHQELDNFVGYWTERSKSGKKERWEMQPTFEVKRRLTTWFSRRGGGNQNAKDLLFLNF